MDGGTNQPRSDAQENGMENSPVMMTSDTDTLSESKATSTSPLEEEDSAERTPTET